MASKKKQRGARHEATVTQGPVHEVTRYPGSPVSRRQEEDNGKNVEG